LVSCTIAGLIGRLPREFMVKIIILRRNLLQQTASPKQNSHIARNIQNNNKGIFIFSVQHSRRKQTTSKKLYCHTSAYSAITCRIRHYIFQFGA
jgi:hypothetical protein